MTAISQARLDVIAADGGCVAQRIDPDAGWCHTRGGEQSMGPMLFEDLEVDRIRDAPAMGKAPSHADRTRMVTLCPGHHRGVGEKAGHVWATAHRPELRAYLAERNARLVWRADL